VNVLTISLRRLRLFCFFCKRNACVSRQIAARPVDYSNPALISLFKAGSVRISSRQRPASRLGIDTWSGQQVSSGDQLALVADAVHEDLTRSSAWLAWLCRPTAGKLPPGARGKRVPDGDVRNFRTTLIENEGPLRTGLGENEPTLIDYFFTPKTPSLRPWLQFRFGTTPPKKNWRTSHPSVVVSRYRSPPSKSSPLSLLRRQRQRQRGPRKRGALVVVRAIRVAILLNPLASRCWLRTHIRVHHATDEVFCPYGPEPEHVVG
jgi:hypothetical protein